MEKLKNNKLIVAGTILISLFIIAITIIVINILNNNNKIKLQKMQENERNEKSEKIRSCTNAADANRTYNIRSNCENTKECPIEVVQWADSRYEQEVNNCYNIYK